ncbi:MAG: hypothetical protein ACR2NA_13230 [Solirubrobacterales bacterium]
MSGAVLNRTAEVVGISNFFSDPAVTGANWADLLAFASNLVPGATLVGYEAGDALDIAMGHGFVTAGSLRVWIHESVGP